MPVEKETEEKIFEAARKVFQERGYEGARMQEIADEASINKSMLHYYYRNKDTLFFKVFQAGVKKIFPQVFEILSSDISLKEKTTLVVEFYHTAFKDNPQLPSFVIFEMNQNPERFKAFIAGQSIEIPEAFLKQVEREIEVGNIKPINPKQFLMNIISMCMMPMVARNMVQSLFKMDNGQYEDFLEERKEIIPDFIFSGASKGGG
ncbi:MAG: TetR/AcrR family transcriptional regulator [Balneolaceae bacterium]|nr:TetR/AcrR family transcriptional regulator [Balneolaceae bacterium]MBO6547659.1 TetR/AcrR family transcriptional regulator [Balneolaceae bacterium]MBO6648170.1 TetR/AcrR family transcriptional regulator [Balneolaceae bacterium]